MAAETSSPPLTWQNWLNLGTYVCNFAVTWLSLTGIFGGTNGDLSKKYQTLITPAGYAFSIWGVIFTWETVFIVSQMLPRFRDSQVTKSVAIYWAVANIAQCLWTFAFAQEQLLLSAIFMLTILLGLVLSAFVADRQDYSTTEFWLLRAPISLHLGWIICASAVNINTVFDGQEAEPATLLAVAVVSFAALAAAAFFYAVGANKPDCFPALVAAWALLAVYSELGTATNLLDPTKFNPFQWDSIVVQAVRMAAMILSIASLCMGILTVVLRLARNQAEEKTSTGFSSMAIQSA